MVTEMVKTDRLLGIKFWAQYYTIRIPHYDVYRYLGYKVNGTNKIHYFANVRPPVVIIGKSEADLQLGDFKPFCIDDSIIRDSVPLTQEEPNAAL